VCMLRERESVCVHTLSDAVRVKEYLGRALSAFLESTKTGQLEWRGTSTATPSHA
jgi:hypothetical protein